MLRALPTRQPEVVLRYYADLSEAQIAAAMGISKGGSRFPYRAPRRGQLGGGSGGGMTGGEYAREYGCCRPEFGLSSWAQLTWLGGL